MDEFQDCYVRTKWLSREEIRQECERPMETIPMDEYLARYGPPEGYGIIDAGFVMVRSDERESPAAAEMRRHMALVRDESGRLIGMTPMREG